MTAFKHGDTQKSRFDLAVFKFEKEVTYHTDYVELTIICVNTGFMVIDVAIRDIEDYYCQLYGIRNDLNQYIIDYMSEQDRLFAHLTSIEMNHELTD